MSGKTGSTVKFTVPAKGRLIDLEMAQPVTFETKLGSRIKEYQKTEKLALDRRHWQTDGVAQTSD